MKKTLKIALVALLCIAMLAGLTACGGPDKSQLEEPYRKAAEAFNELADFVNAHSGEDADGVINEQLIAVYNQMSELLTRYKGIIESNDDITQEQFDAMKKWLEEDVVNYCKTAKQTMQDSLPKA